MNRIQTKIAESKKSVDDIAAASGLPVTRIEVISGGADPTFGELLALAKALGIRASDFKPSSREHERANFLFRQQLGADDEEVLRAIDRLSDQVAKTIELTSRSQDALSWLGEFVVKETSYEGAEYLAEKFRALYFDEDLVSPITSLPSILSDQLNVLVFVVPQQEVDGASAILEGRAFIFLSPRTFAPRMMFTLAHELGHLIAGHCAQQEIAFVDKRNGTGGIQAPSKTREKFADAFASALLMPTSGVGIALKQIRKMHKSSGPIGDIELLYVARIYNVSFESAARRCEDLQLLPRGGARSIYEHLVKEFGSPEKRAEQLELPSRQPLTFSAVPAELLESAIDQVRRGELSLGRASELLPLTIAELYAANADVSE